jgi:hypothetical protein
MMSTRLPDTEEDRVWKSMSPDDMWLMDKLILSKKLGYTCGPVGIDVPKSNWYVVRPCINPMGLGLGTQKVWIENDTTHLPVGHFWCEWFEGEHYSVDFWPNWGNKQMKILMELIKNLFQFGKDRIFPHQMVIYTESIQTFMDA